ncbi:MAG: hypothetical protein II590_02845 [Clostridia bacterium]|nr:hypothetical protein [Clostridia bacterium]
MSEEKRKLHAQLSQMEALMEEKLREGGSVSFSPKGVSMLPMLRAEGDTVTLEKPPARIKKGTVALFISREGDEERFVLHRLVKTRGGELVFCGDNRREPDPPVKKEAVIGVVTAYESRGKAHSPSEPWYRLYSFWMVATSPFRSISMKAQRVIYNVWKKLFRKK